MAILFRRLAVMLAAVLTMMHSVGSASVPAPAGFPARQLRQPSIARQWNEQLLQAIRMDQARPPIHARNLFHLSLVMWDAWAVYDTVAVPFLTKERVQATNVEAARAETISYAAYRLLVQRFKGSPKGPESLAAFDRKMAELGYDKNYTSLVGNTPAAVGNRIAADVINFGLGDGSNEANNYAENIGYKPVNPPLVVALPGNPTIVDPNRWQPLALEFFIDQSGIRLGPYPAFVCPHWGNVTPFSLTAANRGAHTYFDPGPQPLLGGVGDDQFKQDMTEVIRLSSRLTPDDEVLIDISPRAAGNNPLGTNDGRGYSLNPITGQPYTPNVVRRGDFGRVVAEFWADGPNSETPPGHWNVLANYVSDRLMEKRIGGVGPILSDLEWDVKLYLTINGAEHDAAIVCWGNKGYYDSVRPISAIRYMCGLGQCSDPRGPSYHAKGIPLEPGLVEVITDETTKPGQRHAHLARFKGEIAIYAWPGAPPSPQSDYSGVRWIRAATWVPYQLPTFVTPPFAGYFSGHSTYSRAGAEVMTKFTGSAFFPDGLGEYVAPKNQFLKFEQGPSETVTLQWATYYDSADQAGISRLWGGIHPAFDDRTGRIIGSKIGLQAYSRALQYFGQR